jgi:hypothetical protein
MIADFSIYNNVLLTIENVAKICGNCYLYSYQGTTSSNVLLNTLLNCYLPSTTKATVSTILTKYANTNVDLNSLYAKYSYGTQIISHYGINTGADIGTILNPSTINVLINNAVTNTLPCAVLCAYGSGPWGTAWGITVSPNPFRTTAWTNYWIYTTSNDITSADNYQYSFQQSYVSNFTAPLKASLIVLVDNYLNYLYVNKINIITSQIINTVQTLNITLFPGTNLFDFYC